MMKPSLQLRIGQQLTMTPQLQQAIRLLQLPTIELQAQVLQALETNVMLESDEDFEATWSLDAPPGEPSGGSAEGDEAEPVVEIGDDWVEPSAAESETPWSGSADGDLEIADESGRTLRDHLAWQLELAHLPPESLAVGRAIVDAINDDGYLTESAESIAETVSDEAVTDAAGVERVLGIVQQFDPAGVGARSVAECIELQLAQLDPATPGLASRAHPRPPAPRTDGRPAARDAAARTARQQRGARRRARAGAQLPSAAGCGIPGASHRVCRARRIRAADSAGLGRRAQSRRCCRASASTKDTPA